MLPSENLQSQHIKQKLKIKNEIENNLNGWEEFEEATVQSMGGRNSAGGVSFHFRPDATSGGRGEVEEDMETEKGGKGTERG